MRLATVLVLSAAVAAGTIDVTNGWRTSEEPAGAPRDWAAASASDGVWREGTLLEAARAATWFRRAVEVPAKWHGLPLFLVLGREAAGASLYVNGAPARLLERRDGACFEVAPRAGKAPLLLALRLEAGHRGCRAALSTDPRLVVRGKSLFVTDELPVGRTPAPRAQPLRRLPTPALRAEKRGNFTGVFTVFGIPPGRFLVGWEAGSREVWSPSFKLFDEVRPYLIYDGRTVAASDYLALLETTPEGTTLTYALPFGTLRETVFGTTSGDIGTIYVWEGTGPDPVFLALRLSPLFVPMWPAPDEPLARSARWDSGGFLVHGPEDLVAVAGAAGALPPREASRVLGTAGEFALVAPLERGRATAALLACAEGEHAARRRLAGFLRDPLGQLEGSRLAWRRILEETTGIEVPDAALQDVYDWARVSLLQLAVTSRLGTGFVAGVGPSRGGGRPEFA